ncbi:sodium:calcium antiporter [candidate division KSB1 bacterium]
MYDILMPAVIAILSIIVIMKSAEYAIVAIADYAKKTGLSEYFIGFLIVSIGTSLPELSTAFFASLSGQGGLILGNVLGANIIDACVVLGLTAIVGGHIKVKGKFMSKNLIALFIIVLIPLFLGLDGDLSRFDGILLISSFLAYVLILILREGKIGHIKKNVKWKNIWKDMFIFLGCLVALLLSARWLVISSVLISKELGISVYIVGLIFVALGTTVPELTVEIKSVMKGLSGLAFGDVLGSVIVNTSLVLGLAALLNPITLDMGSFFIGSLFMISAVMIAISFMRRKEINWKEGIFLAAFYLFYLAIIISETILVG